jgi:hypothetical protein
MATIQLYAGWQRGDDTETTIGGQRLQLSLGFLNATLDEQKRLSEQAVQWILKREFGVRSEARRGRYLVEWRRRDHVEQYNVLTKNGCIVPYFRRNDGYENV